MKKFLALALASLMLVSFAACSKDDKTTDGGGASNSEIVANDEMVFGNLKYGINSENGLYEIVGAVHDNKTPIDIDVPAKIDGRNVVGIADGAFIDSSKVIKSVKLPDTLTYIGAHAFYGCENITEIVLPDSVTEIGYGAFENCVGLKKITLSAELVTVGVAAFKNCIVLENVTIPSKVTTIGESAFWNCDALTEVVLPEGVKTLGTAAFYDCNALAKATVPASVTEIGEIVFNSCADEIAFETPDGSAFEAYAIANEYIPEKPESSEGGSESGDQGDAQ